MHLSFAFAKAFYHFHHMKFALISAELSTNFGKFIYQLTRQGDVFIDYPSKYISTWVTQTCHCQASALLSRRQYKP